MPADETKEWQILFGQRHKSNRESIDIKNLLCYDVSARYKDDERC